LGECIIGACIEGLVKVAIFLIKNGCNINYLGKEGQRALTEATANAEK
jgi:hypothetical protein